MYIPATFCPSEVKNIFARSVTSDVTSTAESFKSWNTCMDNTACKVVAIVGIVLAVLVCLWILQTVIRCCCMGVTCLEALCCCCCRAANSHRRDNHNQNVYNNPNMYPQPAYYTREPQPSYQPVHTEKTVHTDEDPFHDNKNSAHAYRGYQF